METILFFIKRKKLLKDIAASVFVRITFGKLSAELNPGDAEEAARAKVVTPTKGNGEPFDPPEQSQSPEVKKSKVAEPATLYRSFDYPSRGTPRSISLYALNAADNENIIVVSRVIINV